MDIVGLTSIKLLYNSNIFNNRYYHSTYNIIPKTIHIITTNNRDLRRVLTTKGGRGIWDLRLQTSWTFVWTESFCLPSPSFSQFFFPLLPLLPIQPRQLLLSLLFLFFPQQQIKTNTNKGPFSDSHMKKREDLLLHLEVFPNLNLFA